MDYVYIVLMWSDVTVYSERIVCVCNSHDLAKKRVTECSNGETEHIASTPTKTSFRLLKDPERGFDIVRELIQTEPGE